MNRPTNSLNLERNKLRELYSKGFKYCCDLTEDLQKLSSNPIDEISPTVRAFDILEKELSSSSIRSYDEKLDLVLVDEIVPNSIVEFVGAPGCGKTQLCLLLTISVQIPIEVGKQRQAIYFCTNKNFCSDRLREIARNYLLKHENGKQINIEEDSLLKNVYYVDIKSFKELFDHVRSLNEFLPDKHVQLLIIDSIIYPLRFVENQDRKRILAELFTILRTLMNKYNFCVILTNDLTTIGSSTVPSLGDTFFHFINTRILLDKENNEYFKASLLKSRSKRNVETIFKLLV